jgi:hypothetical protein
MSNARTSLLILPFLLFTTLAALPQSTLLERNPALGSNLSPTNDVAAKKHLTPTGKPCLTMIGASQAQTVNPRIFDNVIVATNACSQAINAKVCYYHSDHCVTVNVPAYSQKQAMLGIMPAMQGFRFEFRELFSPFLSN